MNPYRMGHHNNVMLNAVDTKNNYEDTDKLS